MKLLQHTLASALIACSTLAAALPARADHATPASLTFGVSNARSAVMTAQYWNPILRYVSRQSGVPLRLKLAKSAPEQAAMVGRGEFDFIYSNHQFAPGNDAAGYAVIARPLGGALRSQIIVPADSPITSLDQLRGREVAFPSKAAFASYLVPMDALLRAGIAVKPQFASTVEGTVGQMLSGRVPAAAIGCEIARNYMARQNAAYRVLWSSEEYPPIPIAAHPAVPRQQVEAVRAALIKMADDPEGRAILAASASVYGLQAGAGFVAAGDAEYDHVRRFYRQRLSPQDHL